MSEIMVTSLSDLSVNESITIEIPLPSGDLAVIPWRTLSIAEWDSIGQGVPDPTPPVVGGNKDGPIFNYRDADYLMHVREAMAERNYRRLAKSLRIDIPGETLTEQANAVKNTMDAYVTAALIDFMTRIAKESEARISARAATFQSSKNGNAKAVSS